MLLSKNTERNEKLREGCKNIYEFLFAEAKLIDLQNVEAIAIHLLSAVRIIIIAATLNKEDRLNLLDSLYEYDKKFLDELHEKEEVNE